MSSNPEVLNVRKVGEAAMMRETAEYEALCLVETVRVTGDDIRSGYVDAVSSCGHDAWYLVAITLPGGIPVPTFTLCRECVSLLRGEVS